jgi:hypothetical protein
VQLTTAQAGAVLAQQDAWSATLTSGQVTAWLQDGVLHVRNAGSAAADVPLTGTTVGDRYAGQRSGWTSVAAGAEKTFAPDEPVAKTAPSLAGTARVGATLTAGAGDWTGTAPISFSYHWQRCDGNGNDNDCHTIPGATDKSYKPVGDDVGKRLRVAVLGGNWIAAVSQAVSAPSSVVDRAPAPAPTSGTGSRGSAGGRGGASGRPKAGTTRLALRDLRISPRRFRVAHRRAVRGTRLDGARITWRLNRAATIRVSVQRRARSGKRARWVTVGALQRRATRGAGVIRFTGRFGTRMLKPRSYRLTVTARSGRQRSVPRHVTFRVLAP